MQAKRRLYDMDFSKEGAHVSLVSKKVGGPANGKPVLLLKALNSDKEDMEMIEKSAHEELVLKAVQAAVEPIQKALDEANEQLKQFKAEQVAAIEKARKDALAEVMGQDNPDLEKEWEIVKSLDETVFNLVLKSKKDAFEAIEKGKMFQEVGVSGEAEIRDEAESATARILKQTYNK